MISGNLLNKISKVDACQLIQCPRSQGLIQGGAWGGKCPPKDSSRPPKHVTPLPNKCLGVTIEPPALLEDELKKDLMSMSRLSLFQRYTANIKPWLLNKGRTAAC